MPVYLVLDQYYEDVDVLGIFSTRKKADDYLKFLDPMTGIQTIYEIEIDSEIDYLENE